MARKSEPRIRFAVGTPEKMESSVWRFWVRGSDVYLAARPLAQWIKFSLHKSGVWRLAWTQQQHGEQPGDRLIHRWSRPAEFRPGWVQGPSVGIPATGVVDPLNKHPTDADLPDVVWIPGPQPGTSVFFTVVISRPEMPPEEWQLGALGGRAIAEPLLLRNGERAGVLVTEAGQTDIHRQYVQSLLREAPTLETDDPDDPTFMSLIHVAAKGRDHPMLVEVIPGRERLVRRKMAADDGSSNANPRHIE